MVLIMFMQQHLLREECETPPVCFVFNPCAKFNVLNSAFFIPLSLVLSLLFTLFLPITAVADNAQNMAGPSKLRVAIDDNYSPYIMRRADGSLEGYLVELWKLWSTKTGVTVELIANDWNEAQKTMAEGKAEVIDTIFRTPERELKFDFTQPYATIPVSIYTSSKLAGIQGLNGLHGFQVGVKAGDACQNKLQEGGITDLKAFSDYESLLQAALAETIHVFCMDEPPANFLIFRAGAERELLKAFTLYSGEFHRAVHKGDIATLTLVEQGFDDITAVERKALQQRWMGQSLQHPLLRSLYYFLIIALISILLLAGIALLLRRIVRLRTEALVAVKNQLQDTLNALPDLMFEVDLDGRLLSYHSPRTELLAAPAEQFLGKTLHEILPVNVVETCMQALREAEQKRFSSGQQYELILENGSHWFELSVTRKTPVAAQLPTFIVLSRDITSRKNNEIQIERLKKLYETLSQCNQAMVRCEDEKELFPLICHDVVHFGGMKMAWIGLLDETGTGVIPVASYGAGIEYLDGIEISLDADALSGQGPTGTAIREGEPFWCQNFEQDKASSWWHKRGAKFGWKSTASLPLHRDGRVVGALNLYQDFMNAFDEPAQNLLIELATDISYALNTLYNEAVREQLLVKAQQARTEADQARQTISEIINRVSDGFVALDRDWKYTFVSVQAAIMFERTPEQLMGRHIWTEFPEGMGQKFHLAYEKAMAEQQSIFLEEFYPPYNRWFENRIYPSPEGLTIYFHDITDRKRMELALRDSEEAYRATFDQAAVGIARLSPDGKWLEVNQKLAQILGYSHDELLQLSFQDITHPDDLPADLEKLQEVLAGNIETYKMEKRYLRKSGEYIWINLTVALVRDQDDSPKYFISVIEDINLRIQNEALLHKLSTVVEQSPNPIIITNLDAQIEYVNAAFSAVSGYSVEEALGQNPRIFQSGETPLATYREMWTTLINGEVWRGELLNRHKNGKHYAEEVIIAPVRNSGGEITNYVSIKEDISAKKRAEDRIQQLAYFDQLTGLPNRSQLIDRFKAALSFAQRNAEQMAVMFLDLDHFKNINDTLGHSMGDQLLVEVAHRLRAILREEDILSRLGGDEFILLLPNSEQVDAAQIASKLIEAVTQPYRIEHYELVTTLSIGIALYPHDGSDFETLLKNADTAMYRVKRAARNDFCFFTPDMQAHSARALQLLSALRYALSRNEFELHYQPQISLQDGQVTGAEALIRWRHPEMGMISPAEFIPVAEDSGLILPIGEWVLRTAIQQMKSWMDAGLAPGVIAVNLSVVQFRHPNLTQLVTGILDEIEVPPHYLELELTEAVAMNDPLGAIEVMDKLQQRGIKMSIDDFGTGYSSLSYLKKFKISKLKIDQSFVRDISDDPDDKALVIAIINMARSLGIHTIAEGVETASQLDFLRLQGCDEAQGYYFSKPLPADQFEIYAQNKPA